MGDRIAVLMDRGIEQIDTPAVIYKDPDDLEVARLFGDPSVNVLPGEIEGGAVTAMGRRFRLAGRLPAGPCQVAVRPESIEVAMAEQCRRCGVRFAATKRASPFDVELDAVTPLNVRAVMLLRTGDGRELLATCSEEEASRLPRGHGRASARIAAE